MIQVVIGVAGSRRKRGARSDGGRAISVKVTILPY